MKNIFVSMLAITTMLVACSKNNEDINANGNANGNGNTNGNTQGNGNGAKGALLKKMIEKDEEGKISEVTSFIYTGNLLTTLSIAEYNNGVQKGTQTTTYFYEGNLLKEVKRGQSEEKYYYANGKPAAKTEKEVNEATGYTINRNIAYTYTANKLTNLLETRTVTVFAGGQPQKGTAHDEKQYIYSGNTITEVYKEYSKDQNGAVIQNYYGSKTETTVYTIANGNVIKQVSDKETYEYEYDNKPNPFYEALYSSDPIEVQLLLEEKISKNNITKITKTKIGEAGKEISIFQYRYNAAGYPIEKKAYTEDNGVLELEGSAEYQY